METGRKITARQLSETSRNYSEPRLLLCSIKMAVDHACYTLISSQTDSSEIPNEVELKKQLCTLPLINVIPLTLLVDLQL